MNSCGSDGWLCGGYRSLGLISAEKAVLGQTIEGVKSPEGWRMGDFSCGWVSKGCQDETGSPKRMMKRQRIARGNTAEPMKVKDETKRIRRHKIMTDL